MMIEDPIVLLVDDSENDSLLMRTVFERAGFVQPLRFARDGDEAIAYLRGDGLYGNRRQFPLPTIVLLDLNMPRKNGFEVLAWIRAQPALRRLRVYIMSASSRAEDIQRVYDLGANSYLVKPGNLDGLMHLAKTLVAWLKLSHFAPPTDPNNSRSPFGGHDVEAPAEEPSFHSAEPVAACARGFAWDRAWNRRLQCRRTRRDPRRSNRGVGRSAPCNASHSDRHSQRRSSARQHQGETAPARGRHRRASQFKAPD